MLFETPCLGVGLIPVLEFSRLHVLEVDLVVAETSADSSGDGSDQVDEDVPEIEEGNSSTNGAGGVHRAPGEGALSKHASSHGKADGEGGGILFFLFGVSG